MVKGQDLFWRTMMAGLFVLGVYGRAETVDALGKVLPWRRHVIDEASSGADGVRLADVNGDGLADITTGWEEGGITRVYINPGPDKATDAWPAVTVGKTPAVEDAVFVDLDGDGDSDVLACEERFKNTKGKKGGLGVFWYENPYK